MRSRIECLQVLGVKAPGTKTEIKQAYHDLVKVWHPDRFMQDPVLAQKAQEKLKEINEAYHSLMRMPEPAVSRAAERPKPSGRKNSFAIFWIVVAGLILLAWILAATQKTFQTSEREKALQNIV